MLTMRSVFLKNVLMIASGTAAAQLLTAAITPFLTRLYGPEAFGVFGLFVSVLAVLLPIATLAFPKAIVLPREEAEAENLALISLLCVLFASALVTVLMFALGPIAVGLGSLSIDSRFQYLIPAGLLCLAAIEISKQLLFRGGAFRPVAVLIFLQSLFVNSFKLVFGLLAPKAVVLVLLSVGGNAFLAGSLIRVVKEQRRDVISSQPLSSCLAQRWGSLWELAKRYSDFPLFRAPQAVLNALVSHSPLLLMGALFGPASAGFYFIARKFLELPTNLIGQAVGDVLYPKLAEADKNHQSCFAPIVRVTGTFLLLGCAPVSLVFLYGEPIFTLVLGAGWEVAGRYAEWIALWAFSTLLARPSITAIPVLNMQGWYLIFELVSSFGRIAAILGAFIISASDYLAVVAFSCISAIFNLALITVVLWSSKWAKGGLSQRGERRMPHSDDPIA